jgi:hypothetical protein
MARRDRSAIYRKTMRTSATVSANAAKSFQIG